MLQAASPRRPARVARPQGRRVGPGGDLEPGRYALVSAECTAHQSGDGVSRYENNQEERHQNRPASASVISNASSYSIFARFPPRFPQYPMNDSIFRYPMNVTSSVTGRQSANRVMRRCGTPLFGPHACRCSWSLTPGNPHDAGTSPALGAVTGVCSQLIGASNILPEDFLLVVAHREGLPPELQSAPACKDLDSGAGRLLSLGATATIRASQRRRLPLSLSPSAGGNPSLPGPEVLASSR